MPVTVTRVLSIAATVIPMLAVSGVPAHLPVEAEALPAASQCEARTQVAQVTAVHEGVSVRHKHHWTDAKKGTRVYAGDTVRTKKGQKVALVICGGGKVYVNQESVAVMRSRTETQAKRGEVAEHSSKKGTQQVRTRDAVARSHGTLFDVKVQKTQSVVTVVTGDVGLKNGHGEVHVTKNHQSQVRSDSRPSAPRPVDAQRVLHWADPLAETWKILTAQGAVSDPNRVAVDSHGNVFATDNPAGGGRVVKLSAAGKVLTTWRLQGTTTVSVGVAVDRQDNVYAVDNIGTNVQKFTDNGQWEATYDLQQFTPGRPVAPTGIDVDAAGNMYVAAEDIDAVEKLSPSGQLLARWGSSGSGPVQFDFPQDCAVDAQGNIYVADSFNDRVQKLSPSGQFLLQWTVKQGQFPQDVAVDGSGNVYVAMAARVEEYSPSGRLLRSWQDDASHLLTDPGQFDRATGVTLDARNNLYVADHYNNRIQKLVRGP